MLALLLLWAGAALAQTSKGSITGVVTDQSGAVIAGAMVTATNSDTGEARSAQTGELGQYRIEALEPGRYTVSIRQPGFAPLLLTNIRVWGSVLTSTNAKLQVGQAVTTIQVEASGAGVQTESGTVGAVIGTREVHDLPVLSLSPYELATTLPGCITVTDGSSNFVSGGEASGSGTNTVGVAFSCNGERPRGNNFLLEGQDNNDAALHGLGLQPQNIDAVQEVTFLLNSAPAEFGRGGGAIANLIYQSGTNRFHGAVWDRIKNSALDATDHSFASQGLPKENYRENLYGFAFGGPIKRNKLFFFTSYQWDKFRSSANGGTLLLPTDAGIAVLQQYASNPRIAALLAAYGSLRGDPTRPGAPAPIPLGVDQNTGMDRGSVQMGLFNRTGVPLRYDQPEFDAKGDYIIGPKDTLSLHYIYTSFNTPYDFFHFANNLPGFDSEQHGTWQNAGIAHTHIFNPSVLNEARISYGRMGLFFSPRPDNVPAASGPTISIFGTQGWGANQQVPQSRFHNTYQGQDTVSWTKGAHYLRIGFDFAEVQARDVVPFNLHGSIQYLQGGGYSALANYLDDYSGRSAIVSQTFGSPVLHASMPSQAYFAQDSWKVRPNLTLEIGLRYEYNGTPANQLQFPAIDPDNLACFPCVVKQRGDKEDFGPRVAFAYAPNFWKKILGDGQSVLRGGFGIFYDSEFTNILDNTQATSPNSVASAINSRNGSSCGQPITSRGVFNWSSCLAQLPTTPNPTATVESQVAHLLSPEILQWHLDVQRALPGNMIFDVGYVGTRGEHLFANTYANPFLPSDDRLIPTRGTIVVRDNSGDSIYHALEVQVDKRYSHGLLFRVAYTFSKMIDDASELYNPNPSLSGAPNDWWTVPPVSVGVDQSGTPFAVPRGLTDRSLSNFDHRHRLAITYIYDTPRVPGQGAFAKDAGYLLNGWQISGTTSFQSGTPYTVLTGFDSNGDGVPNDRPSLGNPQAPLGSYAIASNYAENAPANVYCDGPTLVNTNQCVPVPLSQVHWFVPSSGVGNVGRNSLIGPWYTTWNFSFTRNIAVRKGQAMLVRAELFDAFNQAHGDGDGYWPNFLLTSPLPLADFASSRHGGRTVRMLLKYSF